MTTLNLDDSIFITKKTVSRNEYHPDLASQATAGSTTIILSDGSNFSAGDYAYLSTSYGAIGEMVKIISVSGNTVYLKNGLSKTYSTSYDLYKADLSFSSSGDIIRIRPNSVEWGFKKDYNFRNKSIGKSDWGVKDTTPTATDRLKHKETWTIKGYLVADTYSASAKETFLRSICLSGGTVWLYQNFGSDKDECMIDNIKILKEEGPVTPANQTAVERYRYSITIDLTNANEK